MTKNIASGADGRIQTHHHCFLPLCHLATTRVSLCLKLYFLVTVNVYFSSATFLIKCHKIFSQIYNFDFLCKKKVFICFHLFLQQEGDDALTVFLWWPYSFPICLVSVEKNKKDTCEKDTFIYR